LIGHGQRRRIGRWKFFYSLVRRQPGRGWRILVPRYREVTMDRAITSKPDIMGGTPCLAGTRVPFQTLLDYLEAGDSLEIFLADFPSVPRELAITALQQAGDLAVAHARAV
jgi:uncharacterized protein (DUF433 family)